MQDALSEYWNGLAKEFERLVDGLWSCTVRTGSGTVFCQVFGRDRKDAETEAFLNIKMWHTAVYGGDASRECRCHDREAAPGRVLPELIEAILSGSADQIKACCADARSEDIRASLDTLEAAVGFRAGFLQGNPSIFKIGVTAGMGLAQVYLQQRATAEASSDD